MPDLIITAMDKDSGTVRTTNLTKDKDSGAWLQAHRDTVRTTKDKDSGAWLQAHGDTVRTIKEQATAN